jgi:hypothetical protein
MRISPSSRMARLGAKGSSRGGRSGAGNGHAWGCSLHLSVQSNYINCRAKQSKEVHPKGGKKRNINNRTKVSRFVSKLWLVLS